MELNSIVADMFKTAYICHHRRSRESHVADFQNGDVAQFRDRDAGLRDISVCNGREMSIRPASGVSASSSSDSATETNVVDFSVMQGLGSVSSITESVNSWSFRFPETSCVASAANDATDERSTLLLDNRRQNGVTSADTAGNCSQSVHPQVRFLACFIAFEL